MTAASRGVCAANGYRLCPFMCGQRIARSTIGVRCILVVLRCAAWRVTVARSRSTKSSRKFRQAGKSRQSKHLLRWRRRSISESALSNVDRRAETTAWPAFNGDYGDDGDTGDAASRNFHSQTGRRIVFDFPTAADARQCVKWKFKKWEASRVRFVSLTRAHLHIPIIYIIPLEPVAQQSFRQCR